MCGIIGIYSQSTPVAASSIGKALAALSHRGPDGTGLWQARHGLAALGHTRLSVIDLETGAQPIASEDGQLQIVCNGEFYGFEELRAQLQARGHRFRTRSDSEVALHLYEEHGTDCLKYLRGEFAFIIWDERRRTLMAARDRFGIKPLCYAQVAGRLYIASEAKALFAAGVSADWDEYSFYHAASLQYVPPDRTLFNGVRQVPPGTYLLVRDNSISLTRYWDLDYPREPRAELDEQEAIEEFRSRLTEAVRLRLRADVPVACYLSGGLDSSAILGLVMAERGAPVDCFSICFDDERYDEFNIAAETARHCGARFHPIAVSPAALLDNLSAAVYYSEGLAINGHLPAKFILSRKVKEAGVKVVLTGEGADEIAAGYLHLRTDLLAQQGQRLYGDDNIIIGIQLPHGESLPLHAVQERLGFVPSFLQAKGTFGQRLHALLAPDLHAHFSGLDCYRALMESVNVSDQLCGRHPVNQSLYLWTKLSLANYILKTLGDGTEMANSVEGRLPFLDHHLFELARRLPMPLKIKNGVEKFIIREAARPVLTETVYRREKHPFTAPPLIDKGAEFVQDILRGQAFAKLPFFDHARVVSLLDQLPAMNQLDRQAVDPVLMTILTAVIIEQELLTTETRRW